MLGLGLGISPIAVRRSGSGGSTATALPQPSLIYDRFQATSLSGLANNDSVTTLTSSVKSLVGTGTGGSQGVYKTARAPSGQPTIQFSKVQNLDFGRDANQFAAMAHASGSALVIVGRNYTTNSSSYGCPVGVNASSGSPSGIFNPAMNAGGVGFLNVVNPTTRMPGFSATGFNVYVMVRDPVTSQSRIYLNGSCIYATSNILPATSGSGNWLIGGANNSFGSAFEFHEAIIYAGGVLGQCDVLQLTKSLFETYGETLPWAGYSDFWLFDGDSTVAGTGGAGGYSMPYYVINTYARPLGTWSVVATPSTTMSAMTTNGPRDIDTITSLTGLTVKMFVYEFTNRSSTPYANCATQDFTFLAARKAAQPTIKIAMGNSIALAGAAGDGSNGTNRMNYNANMVTNAATYISNGVTSFVDMAANTNIGVLNANPGSGYPTTYWNDTLHPFSSVPTAAGPNGYTEFAGMVGPVMAAL